MHFVRINIFWQFQTTVEFVGSGEFQMNTDIKRKFRMVWLTQTKQRNWSNLTLFVHKK